MTHTQLQRPLQDVVHDVRHQTNGDMEVVAWIENWIAHYSICGGNVIVKWPFEAITVRLVELFCAYLNCLFSELPNRKQQTADYQCMATWKYRSLTCMFMQHMQMAKAPKSQKVAIFVPCIYIIAKEYQLKHTLPWFACLRPQPYSIGTCEKLMQVPWSPQCSMQPGCLQKLQSVSPGKPLADHQTETELLPPVYSNDFSKYMQ